RSLPTRCLHGRAAARSFLLDPVAKSTVPSLALGQLFLPGSWIGAQPGISSVHLVQKFLPLVMLNGFVQNCLHGLPFSSCDFAKGRLGPGTDTNVGVCSCHK